MKQQETIVKKSKILKLSIFIILFVFLVLNIISSQQISPLYFKFINNDKQATVNLLEKIKTFPEFQKVLEMNIDIYGKTIEEETFRQEKQEKLMINNLEQKLAINPKSRDILYSLYQLYLSSGDKNKAAYYLRLAKEVDPSVK